MRTTKAVQVKFEHLRSISKMKGSITTQMKAIKREVVSRLVCHLPGYVEVDVFVDVILINLCRHMLGTISFMTTYACHSVWINGNAS